MGAVLSNYISPMSNPGVEYTPYTISCTPSPTLEQLKCDGIKFIRIQWVDLTNTIRFRVVPVSYFEKLLKCARPGVSLTTACLGLVYLTMAPGFSPIGEYLYVIDMKTLKICPYAPGHATVMGWFQEKTPTINSDSSLSSVLVDICPRTLLHRIIKEAKTVSNVDFLVGFESEFILLKSTKPIEAANHHSWSTSDGLPSGQVETIVLEEIAVAVQESGIELLTYHPEAAPGQYEVVTGPLPPLEAADALIHTREIIRNTAFKHGLRATFAPRLYMTSAGSSTHTNISVHSPTESEKKPEGLLSTLESSFLAGVLARLPAMFAITLPIPASYKRMADGVWSGGTYVCWGIENRESPIRLTNATASKSRRFEMRFVDGTANPYLVLAAILAAGHEGIRTRQQLTIQNCPGPMTAAQISDEDRRKLGIICRLPLSWEAARSQFEADQWIDKVFGSSFVTKYLSVNKVLGDALEQDETEQEKLARLVEFF